MESPTMKTRTRTSRGLSVEAASWYRALADEFGLEEDAYGRLLLALAMQAHRRMEQAAQVVEELGPVVKDSRGRAKANPAVAAERDARAQVLAALKSMQLDVEPARPGPGRPPGSGGGGR
jgi:ParB-like chromosome segregation protein Spo0J